MLGWDLVTRVTIRATIHMISSTPRVRHVRLMDKILHYLKDPKLWELWYIPYNG